MEKLNLNKELVSNCHISSERVTFNYANNIIFMVKFFEKKKIEKQLKLLKFLTCQNVPTYQGYKRKRDPLKLC